MSKISVRDASGRAVREVELPDRVFAYPVKPQLLHETAVNRLANRRRGTAATKTRGEVAGSNRKPWRQKGTGRARVGMIRNPLWRKGGTVHGPQPRDYAYELPKKVRTNALRSALALKHKEGMFLVVDEIAFAAPKTKEGAAWLKGLKVDSALVVDAGANVNLFQALRNIPRVQAIDERQVGAFDVLRYKWLILTGRAFEALMERLK
ncbi:MAG: 50S ribosomal protein L4 [Candidatus Aminicenantes bacterium]|nr:50S ribosomal protein L4 [Candidatus Aminicenantes bacterium]